MWNRKKGPELEPINDEIAEMLGDFPSDRDCPARLVIPSFEGGPSPIYDKPEIGRRILELLKSREESRQQRPEGEPPDPGA